VLIVDLSVSDDGAVTVVQDELFKFLCGHPRDVFTHLVVLAF
jgi:hypothetical protein